MSCQIAGENPTTPRLPFRRIACTKRAPSRPREVTADADLHAGQRLHVKAGAEAACGAQPKASTERAST